MFPTFAFFTLTPWEILILLGIGVMLFGRKLPEMGRVVGRAFSEFKNGMSGMEDEVTGSITASPRHEPIHLQAPRPPQRVVASAPAFENSSITITPPTI